MITEAGETLAVLSVDPSSPFSQGSILGDKTRMERLSQNRRAYIRPSPSRGHLGGIARHTRETILLCEAAGFSNIFVETVGVGQSETAVRSMTDFFLLLTLAGAGDELQGMKRGILEMVDLLAVNKADGENLGRAGRARAELAAAMHYLAPPDDGWQIPVVTCSAVTGAGLREIWDHIRDHSKMLQQTGRLQERRRKQNLSWMRELVRTGLEDEFAQSAAVSVELPDLQRDVLAGKTSPVRAARRLLGVFFRKH
jgi:LAO/AO transport system kinase